MILAHGKIYDTAAQNELLSSLSKDTNETLLHKTVDRYKLIGAVETLSSRIKSGEYDDVINALDIDGADEYIEKALTLLCRDNITFTLDTQLGYETDLPEIYANTAPVGVLFHIAAGNVDVLPAYSVLEGLLCGNVNVLKLPSQDNGLTVKILYELISVMPEIADFIYVFDTPSSDAAAMVKMAEAADKIIVWGGDEAVAAVRKFAPPCADIVKWGHKISFACVTAGSENRGKELEDLAEHIVKTEQLFCSSCQRIFVITDDKKAAEGFCRDFLPILQRARDRRPLRDKGALAEYTLSRYISHIESVISGGGTRSEKTFYGKDCSVSFSDEAELEISGFFGNITVNAVSKDELFYILRKKKGYLQTACVIGDDPGIEDILIKAGVTRIMRPGEMSDVFTGEAHDGEYPLRRYTRIINRQKERAE